MQDTLLEMTNISKHFPGVLALQNVSFSARASKVNVLIGENGAGKSTLMKILAGVIEKDEGSIVVAGEKIQIKNPLDARRHRIAMIHQELNLIPYLSIAENIHLGRMPSRAGVVNKRQMLSAANRLLEDIGLPLDARTILENLSTGQKQMVEIVKAMSIGSRIIIMDEPTSSLTEHEVTILFKLIDRLRKEGVAIIYISHKLDEVFTIGDTIWVLRDGQNVGEFPVDSIDRHTLIRHMVGREITALFPRTQVSKGATALSAQGLTLRGKFTDVSFDVKKGEILGFFGLVGAGRSEVAHAIFGSHPVESGTITVDGKRKVIRTTKDGLRAGIGFVPEDRKLMGLNTLGSVAHNITLTIFDTVSRIGVFNARAEKTICDRMVKRLNIKTPNTRQLVNHLSGGNQQKVVLSKWIARNAKVLILDEPTRGVDVGAKSEIHKLMDELTAQGIAIIMISSELPEILGMSDRICVMHDGKLTACLEKSEATQERIMYYATGSSF
jgi:ABC-type sugar transport system ATPase subunit